MPDYKGILDYRGVGSERFHCNFTWLIQLQLADQIQLFNKMWDKLMSVSFSKCMTIMTGNSLTT